MRKTVYNIVLGAAALVEAGLWITGPSDWLNHAYILALLGIALSLNNDW